jgi:hypothetical protein
MIEDARLFCKEGIIAFYQSCEVIQLFLIRKSDKQIIHLFMVAVLEELSFTGRNQAFLGKPLNLNSDYQFGIQHYSLTPEECCDMMDKLSVEKKWDIDGNDTLLLPPLKFIPKQYVPGDQNRFSHILKNNFHGGSYILEFFNEDKSTLNFLLEPAGAKELDLIVKTLQKYLPIDLGQVLDRIGNIVFQFPITLLETNPKALSSWDGVSMEFAWHEQLQDIPDCLLQVESSLDGQLMGAKLEIYNKLKTQNITIGSLDQVNLIRVWREKPSLILNTYSGGYIRDIDFNMNIGSHQPRFIFVDNKLSQVEVHSVASSPKPPPKRYDRFITMRRDEAARRLLEENLSFKQYRNVNHDVALGDLRALIKSNSANGVWIWDPFLSAVDILKTVYYAPTAGIPIRAIGSITSTVRTVYNLKGLPVADIISDYRRTLEHPPNNSHGINFEFRLQHDMHGWAFHDRFLIFPGVNDTQPKVYSLGTSVNSFGNDHHILQLISHPKPVIDEFNKLWDALNNLNCLVWKFPKP